MTEEEYNSIPRSMVVHLGSSLKNRAIGDLVRDTRHMMMPHTMLKIRERKSNKVKDFTSVASSLGVSFMMLYSQNETSGSVHLRFSKMSNGPTISYKVVEYSLCKDIISSQKNPKSLSSASTELMIPPLLVLNGFTNPKDAEPQEKLAVTMFQNMFPPISPQDTNVNTIKRVLLINKDKETGLIDIRHYMIETKLVDVSKNVRKLVNIKRKKSKRLPNLARVGDVSDVILDPYAQAGFTSDSEVEEDSIVEVKEVVKTPIPDGKRKRAVKLVELGPRLKLELEKIEEGICDGRVLYHERIHKTKEEEEYLDQVHAKRRKEKEERKRIQKENVEKKRKVSFKEPEEKDDDDDDSEPEEKPTPKPKKARASAKAADDDDVDSDGSDLF